MSFEIKQSFVPESSGDVIELLTEVKELKRLLTGRGGVFRKSPPKGNGYAKYVWRELRFWGGEDKRIPITHIFDFERWFMKHVPGAEGTCVNLSYTKAQWKKDVFGHINNEVIPELMKHFGLSELETLRAWRMLRGSHE